MKEFISRSSNLYKVEFWAVTTVFVFGLFFLTADAVRNDGIGDVWTSYRNDFEQAHIPYNYNQFYFFPQLIRYTVFYLAFLLLNFRVVPDLINRNRVVQNILLSVCVYLLIAICLSVTDTYLRNYIYGQYVTKEDAWNFFFQNGFVHAAWIVLLYGFYTVIKYGGIYLITNSEMISSRYQMVTKEGIAAFVLWMVTVFLLVVINANQAFIAIWIAVIPFAIFFYWYSFYAWIPGSLKKKRPFGSYLVKIFIGLLISVLPLILLGVLALREGDKVAIVVFFNAAFQLLITAPFSWTYYRHKQKGSDEIVNLKTALGQSDANLSFLRSQINPHFLFNALNTVYGTALIENAPRTSEGIERLGDMMRFMLQENMQEKISLAREIDYLNNYISFQRLRTDTNPEVKIEAQIDDKVNTLQIPPMLLIPFVENAFKHGISLREPSHVKITLQLEGPVLYFDVNNSKHVKPDNDPEKYGNGIGLKNVGQRLDLLFPGRHELIIRDTAREFFVHLTLNLE